MDEYTNIMRRQIQRHNDEWETRKMIESIFDERSSKISDDVLQKMDQKMIEKYLPIFGSIFEEMNRGKSAHQAVEKIREELGFEITFKE